MFTQYWQEAWDQSKMKPPRLLWWFPCWNIPPKRKHCRVVSAIEVHPMSCSSTNIYSHIYLHLTRPSCRPLIGFGWVMSTIDRKYNLIRSLERQHWDGRYWKRMGMVINETTPTQCSIISIWFINYPWRWGFYLARHANWQKETHTHRVEGNVSWKGFSFFLLCNVDWCDSL